MTGDAEVVSLAAARAAREEAREEAAEAAEADRYVGEVHLYETPDGRRYHVARGPYQDLGAVGRADLARSLACAAATQGFASTEEHLAEGDPQAATRGFQGVAAVVVVYHSSWRSVWLSPHVELGRASAAWIGRQVGGAAGDLARLALPEDERPAEPEDEGAT